MQRVHWQRVNKANSMIVLIHLGLGTDFAVIFIYIRVLSFFFFHSIRSFIRSADSIYSHCFLCDFAHMHVCAKYNGYGAYGLVAYIYKRLLM